MKIYSMTATFGKLENQTLTFQPGLNVIQAPNEWGKTTWCAFLVNMLYGIETRVKSTKAALADKERYAPWSGSPMSGRIELNWQGRDITIERWTKGRTPLGEFRAYETDSGMAVEELTGSDCGEKLLGVERSAFLRCGFLRLADLPVTDDEALRRRLNALVTTGDESSAADELAQKLRDLKNKCRSNRTTGLIPAAEREAAELEETLRQLSALRAELEENGNQQTRLNEDIAALENHRAALEYAAGEENNRRILAAQARREEAKARLDRLEKVCADLDDPEKCAASAEKLRQLHQQTMAMDMEQQMLPPAPEKPAATVSWAAEQAGEDRRQCHGLEDRCRKLKESDRICWFGSGAIVLAALILLLSKNTAVGAAVLAGAVPLAAMGLLMKQKTGVLRRQRTALIAKYGPDDPEKWVELALAAQSAEQNYAAELAQHEQALVQFRRRRESLNGEIKNLTQGRPISDCLHTWGDAARRWAELSDARQAYEDADAHAQVVAAMAKPVEKPTQPDQLTYPMEQTRQLLEQALARRQSLQQRHSNCQGRMESMGREEDLQRQLEAVRERIGRLEKTFAALELAQTTLAAATAELQRRFAPQIARDAQQIFTRLTGGRYDRLSLSRDMALQTGAEEESVLHTAQWRSEGTADQMYLALRLAVSKALTPEAPLILDDALVRFDDVRHAVAMDILRQEAQSRQIILFTCQGRELQ